MALGYVRPARPGDAAEIARVQYATWRIAYPRFIPRFAVDEVSEEWLAERWAEAVERPPSERHRVLVAIEQADEGAGSRAHASSEPAPSHVPERLVGFTAIGPADEAALAPDEAPGEAADPVRAAITDLLVEPRWGRRGHGSRLLAAAVEMWRTEGFGQAVAWA